LNYKICIVICTHVKHVWKYYTIVFELWNLHPTFRIVILIYIFLYWKLIFSKCTFYVLNILFWKCLWKQWTQFFSGCSKASSLPQDALNVFLDQLTLMSEIKAHFFIKRICTYYLYYFHKEKWYNLMSNYVLGELKNT